MYNLLHIHNNIIFIDHSRRYVNERFSNSILFIGIENENNVRELNKYGIPFKIYDETKNSPEEFIEYANKFDGVIFHSLNEVATKILLELNLKVKAFLKLFGYELYMLDAKKFLSDSTWNLQPKRNSTLIGNIKAFFYAIKRKIKIALGREYIIQKIDNQERIYKRFDAILIINKYEYDELKRHFYLPKLIERQLVDSENEARGFNAIEKKSNKIILGNSGSRWNNHIDLLNIIANSNNIHEIEFNLFFSYETESIYSQKVKYLAERIQHVNLIENFLSKVEFDAVYASAAALVINSYRQHAIGNIITAIKYGCKIYLSKRSSTYEWLISKSFLISEVDELKNDIENNNIVLSLEQQQHNFDCFLSVVKNYSVNDFMKNVEKILQE